MTDTREVWLLVKVPDVAGSWSDEDVVRGITADIHCEAVVTVAEQVGWHNYAEALHSNNRHHYALHGQHDACTPVFRQVNHG